MKPGSRLKFSPLLAAGGAAIHLAIFISVSFAIFGWQNPSLFMLRIGIVTEIILAPPLLILLFSGSCTVPPLLLLLSVVISSALYGALLSLLFSLLVSYLQHCRPGVPQPVEKTDSNAAPY